MYGNEKQVGEAIRASGLDRGEVFVTSKLNNGFHAYDDALRAFDGTLRALGDDYVDLFLIHWPMPDVGDYVETWRAMERILASGGARAIGVSNFQPHHLQRVLDETDVVPAVNQIEAHPYLTQDDARGFGAAHGIVTEAWSPIAQGKVLDDPVIVEVAERLGRTPAQVTLRWHIQRGDVVFPKSVTRPPGRGELRAVRLRARPRRHGRHHRPQPRRAHRARPRPVQLGPEALTPGPGGVRPTPPGPAPGRPRSRVTGGSGKLRAVPAATRRAVQATAAASRTSSAPTRRPPGPTSSGTTMPWAASAARRAASALARSASTPRSGRRPSARTRSRGGPRARRRRRRGRRPPRRPARGSSGRSIHSCLLNALPGQLPADGAGRGVVVERRGPGAGGTGNTDDRLAPRWSRTAWSHGRHPASDRCSGMSTPTTTGGPAASEAARTTLGDVGAEHAVDGRTPRRGRRRPSHPGTRPRPAPAPIATHRTVAVHRRAAAPRPGSEHMPAARVFAPSVTDSASRRSPVRPRPRPRRRGLDARPGAAQLARRWPPRPSGSATAATGWPSTTTCRASPARRPPVLLAHAARRDRHASGSGRAA